MSDRVSTRSVTAQNQFSDGVEMYGYFNISISGTFVATVSLQRSFDAGVTWHTVETHTVPTETIEHSPEKDVQYRIGVATGGFTSGTAVCRISQ